MKTFWITYRLLCPVCRKGTFRTKNCQCYFCLLHCPLTEWEPNKRMISSQLGLTLTLQDIWTWGERRAGYIMITVSSFKPLRRGGGGWGQANMCVCVCWAQGRCLALTKSERRRQRQWNLAASNFGIHALSLSFSLSHLHTLLYSLTHTFILTHTHFYTHSHMWSKAFTCLSTSVFPNPCSRNHKCSPSSPDMLPQNIQFSKFELKNKIILQNLRTFIRFYLLSTPEL